MITNGSLVRQHKRFTRTIAAVIVVGVVIGAVAVGQGPTSQQTDKQASLGVIEGDILDPTKAPVDGALVMAVDGVGRERCHVTSDSVGHFACRALLLGEYQVLVSAPGFTPQKLSYVLIGDGRPSPKLLLKLTLAGESTVVTVSARSYEVATEQIHAEEKQRILGIVPNFYTSFTPDAAPLSSGQKYSLAFRDLVDPVTFLSAGVAAGIEQANNSYSGYGQGISGYGKRYAAAYGDGLSSDLLRHAVFASLFHQDPRYFYKGTGSFKSRALHAMSFAIMLRGDDGTVQPNYSYLAGYLASGALSNAYYPDANRGAGLVFTRALVGIAGAAGQGLLREFVWSHVTSNHPPKP